MTFTPPSIVSGDRLGVYWEYRDADGNDLKQTEPGSIRLIGRYWEEGKTYVVSLTGHTPDGRTGSIDIMVEKPARLGNGPERVEDVFGHMVSIDSLIINCAGQNGIPPQIIKSQIQHESNFMPAYRYEPEKDLEYHESKTVSTWYFGQGNNFVVTNAGMGSGPKAPPLHTYVPPIGKYIISPISIRDFLADHPWQYVTTRTLTFFYIDAVSRRWRSDFVLLHRNNPRESTQELLSQSLSMAMDAFRQGLIGGTQYDGYAQTRIMASYGFLQLTHYNATDLDLFGFTKKSSTQPPELLNDESYNFPAYAARMLIKLKLIIGKSLPESNWVGGYESTWLKVLKTYNPGEKNYGVDVISNSRNYSPIAGE